MSKEEVYPQFSILFQLEPMVNAPDRNKKDHTEHHMRPIHRDPYGNADLEYMGNGHRLQPQPSVGLRIFFI
jgi:hypothetical protein